MMLAILIIFAIVFILALIYIIGCLVDIIGCLVDIIGCLAEKQMLSIRKKYQDHIDDLVAELFPPDIPTPYSWL